MTTRPPADAIVALRSLDRRFRDLFADPPSGGNPDDVAQRNGPDGRSALDHVAAAARTLAFLSRALEQTLVEEDPVLHPAVIDATAREWPDATGTVEEQVSELASEANAMADRAAAVGAQDWVRAARVASHDATVTATTILWDAVDSAVEHLRSAERSLA